MSCSKPMDNERKDLLDENLYFNHVVQYSKEYSLCAGCETCSIMCAMTHDGIVSPGCARIQINLATRSLIHEVLTCQHCKDHPCYDKCPRKDQAMKIDENGIVYIDEENCIGCGLCIKACRFDPPRIVMMRDKDRKKWRAKKCDMCRTSPDGPQCIKWCPVVCIGLSSDAEFRDGELFPKNFTPQPAGPQGGTPEGEAAGSDAPKGETAGSNNLGGEAACNSEERGS